MECFWHLRLGGGRGRGSWVGDGLPRRKVGAEEERSGKRDRSTFLEKGLGVWVWEGVWEEEVETQTGGGWWWWLWGGGWTQTHKHKDKTPESNIFLQKYSAENTLSAGMRMYITSQEIESKEESEITNTSRISKINKTEVNKCVCKWKTFFICKYITLSFQFFSLNICRLKALTSSGATVWRENQNQNYISDSSACLTGHFCESQTKTAFSLLVEIWLQKTLSS